MKNVTQALDFPVTSVVPTQFPVETQELMANASRAKAALATAVGPNELDALKAAADETLVALQAAIPEQIKKELTYFGAASPLDTVSVSVKLGTLFFDLYALGTPKPDAPLHQLIWQKRNMELAETVDKDEFELPTWAVGAIRGALLDDKVWKTVNVSAWVEVPAATEGEESATKRFFSMKSVGAQFFGEIMQAAAEALYTDELKDTK